jgi:HEXXH motif-containing protein
VSMEDTDPYRDAYHAPPSQRLPDQQYEQWQALFEDAWELLGELLPERAAEMANGLRSLVPLKDDGSGAARSGTARDSIGAAGLTRPTSAADFAVTLVHEFQHSKLSAVLDLHSLYIDGGKERHFAPWRVDARPTSGLMHGVYAFLGVADAWRALRAAPSLDLVAAQQFATTREQVRVALTSLEQSFELTPNGRRFVQGMRGALDRLLAESLPDAMIRDARRALAERRASWDRRHPGLTGRN